MPVFWGFFFMWALTGVGIGGNHLGQSRSTKYSLMWPIIGFQNSKLFCLHQNKFSKKKRKRISSIETCLFNYLFIELIYREKNSLIVSISIFLYITLILVALPIFNCTVGPDLQVYCPLHYAHIPDLAAPNFSQS